MHQRRVVVGGDPAHGGDVEHPGATRIYNPTGVNSSTEEQTRARGHGGQRTSVAGLVARHRPPTAKGFVFSTMENAGNLQDVIVRPDVYQSVL